LSRGEASSLQTRRTESGVRLQWNNSPIAIPEIPSETIESPGVAVSPASLYLAQLRERLGPEALSRIGY